MCDILPDNNNNANGFAEEKRKPQYFWNKLLRKSSHETRLCLRVVEIVTQIELIFIAIHNFLQDALKSVHVPTSILIK